MTYDESYFSKLNYADYLGRGARYAKTAEEMDWLFRSLRIANKNSIILDYGCAVGFLMDGFRELGYTSIIGYDISSWATDQARQKKHVILDRLDDVIPDVMISLDVFEHMEDAEIESVVSIPRRALVVRIPCSTNGADFALEISRRDPTHVNCKTKSQWVSMLKKHYDSVLFLDMFTIYDGPGVACILGVNSER
jgi:cyclopropane fatty-acyl-phospholipid synthase-like methyltransferase